MANKRITLPPTDGSRHNSLKWLAVFNVIADYACGDQEDVARATDEVFAALAVVHRTVD